MKIVSSVSLSVCPWHMCAWQGYEKVEMFMLCVQKWSGKLQQKFIQANHIELSSVCLEFFLIYTFYN